VCFLWFFVHEDHHVHEDWLQRAGGPHRQGLGHERGFGGGRSPKHPQAGGGNGAQRTHHLHQGVRYAQGEHQRKGSSRP